jgi:hypothetical protein
MRLLRTRILKTIAVLSLFVAGVATADDEATVAEAEHATTTDTASLNTDLAASANIAAAEDAVEAVLAANKLDLDIRLIGRTLEKIADGR